MSELLIRGHLGLGDHLICNAIYREYAKRFDSVVVLVKTHNNPSVSFMLRDVINIETFSVANDTEADQCVIASKAAGFEILKLGMFSELPFDFQAWDRSFYKQAGIDHQQRWNGFVVPRQPSRELDVPDEPYCLIHDDPSRDCHINHQLLPDLPILRVEPIDGCTLFDYWGLMESATELHFMESSPAILVDSLPLVKARRRVMHFYCRTGVPPKYQTSWEVIP